MSRIAGLVVLAVLMALVAAFPAGAQVRRAAQDTDRGGLGRLGRHRRPARHAGGDRRPALRRQRRRRRGRGGRRARRRRAVLVRHRRRRLHGHLRRQAPQGRHDRLARGGARRRASPTPSRPSRRAAPSSTEARVSGLSVGVPGTVAGLGEGAQALRHALAALAAAARPSGSPARASSSTRPSTARSTSNEERLRRLHLDARDSTSTDAGTRRRSAPSRRNPDLAETYERIGDDPDRFYRGADRARHRRRPCSTRRRRRLRPPARGAPGHDDPARPRALRGDPPRPDAGSATAGSTSSAWARRPRAARPSARR